MTTPGVWLAEQVIAPEPFLARLAAPGIVPATEESRPTANAAKTSSTRVSPHGVSFLTDAIVLQHYVEMQGELRRLLLVAKMRGFDHKKELRLYDIGPGGIVMGEALTEYVGTLVGVPRLVSKGDDKA